MSKKRAARITALVLIVLLIIAGSVWIILRMQGSGEVNTENAFNSSLETVQNEPEKYVSPVDFDSLVKKNSDIYAWLEIPGTNISFPVVNRPGDNEFYLNHNSDTAKDKKGAIFTEDYNTRDFTDPVTILYGHKMRDGDMFGLLQKTFSNREFFNSKPTVNIYLPDKKLEYRVFAAVPYSSIHLLHHYDFTDERIFDGVLYDIMSVRSVNALVDETVLFDSKDHIIILSTCLPGNADGRYLVLAVNDK